MKRFYTDKTKKVIIKNENINLLNDPVLIRNFKLTRYKFVFYILTAIIYIKLILSVLLKLNTKYSETAVSICAVISVIIIVIIFALFERIINGIYNKVKEKDPDLTSAVGNTDKERIDLDEYGLSYIYFGSQGGRGSKDLYVRKLIRKSDIQEILYCNEMNVIILKGKVSLNFANGTNIYKKDYSDWLNLEIYRSNLRIYAHWLNPESPSDDLLREISELFASNIRYIGTDEALELIKNDKWSDPQSNENEFRKEKTDSDKKKSIRIKAKGHSDVLNILMYLLLGPGILNLAIQDSIAQKISAIWLISVFLIVIIAVLLNGINKLSEFIFRHTGVLIADRISIISIKIAELTANSIVIWSVVLLAASVIAGLPIWIIIIVDIVKSII